MDRAGLISNAQPVGTGNYAAVSIQQQSPFQQQAPFQQAPPAADQQQQMQQQQQPELTILQRSSHPTALIFHLLFRISAIVFYLIISFTSINFILAFIIIMLLLAFDFWTVKNVSGRLLVGLRWWNEIQEDGTSKWIFESRQDNTKNNPTDSRVFWYSLYITQAVWIVFAIIQILKLGPYFLVDVIALVLNSSNIVGYTKCEKDAKKKLQGFAAQTIFQNFNPFK